VLSGDGLGAHLLMARMDSVGDVLLAGPAVRAVAAGAARVSLLVSPRGEAAARLLPGVDRVIVGRAGWIEADGPAVTQEGVTALVGTIADAGVDEAVILTSFHQSPLPLALVLRMAGVARIGATSVDFPGTLLDVRHQLSDDGHEVERSLSLCAAMGFELPPGDDGRLRVVIPSGTAVPSSVPSGDFVVVHPGASVSARSWHATGFTEVVRRLTRDGVRVVVTGGADERGLTAAVAGRHGIDLGGGADLATLAAILRRACAVVVANTGPAHLAAAVGTPVVSVFAPTVPAVRWRPWGVEHRLLGVQDIECAGCRARVCPVAGHPCVDAVRAATVIEALFDLVGGRDRLLATAGEGVA
jgi:ADP-heptose:LPS heptosyltransferase